MSGSRILRALTSALPLLLLPTPLFAADGEAKAYRGHFTGLAASSEIRLEEVVDNGARRLSVHHPGVTPMRLDIEGEIEAVRPCFSPALGRDSLSLVMCSDRPDCREHYIYIDPDGGALKSHRQYSFDYPSFAQMAYWKEEGGGTICAWAREQKFKNRIDDLFAKWVGTADRERWQAHFTDVREASFSIRGKPVRREDIDLARWLRAHTGVTVTDLSENDRWQLSVFAKTETCDADGVLIAHRKGTDRYLAIYGVPSGCSKALNFVPRKAVLDKDVLTAEFCVHCRGWGRYGPFRWNLATGAVERMAVR